LEKRKTLERKEEEESGEKGNSIHLAFRLSLLL